MRIQGWPERLATLIERHAHTPFGWGTFDCCLFAADAVEKITGEDYGASYRGTYRTQKGAYRALSARGIDSVDTIPDEYFARIPVLMARRGDLCAVTTTEGMALGICCGISVACAGEHGVEMLPLSAAVTAWRVE